MSALCSPNYDLGLYTARETTRVTQPYQLMQNMGLKRWGSIKQLSGSNSVYYCHKSESGTIFSNYGIGDTTNNWLYLPDCEPGLTFTFWNEVDSDKTLNFDPRWSFGDRVFCQDNNIGYIISTSSSVRGTNAVCTIIGTQEQIWKEIYRPVYQNNYFDKGIYGFWYPDWGRVQWNSYDQPWVTVSPNINLHLPKVETAGQGWTYFPPGTEHGTIAKTADYSVPTSENGAIYTNTGAAGTIRFTLPAASPGLHYAFCVAASQKIIVAVTAGDLIQIGHRTTGQQNQTSINSQAGTATLSQTRNRHIWLMAVDDTNWLQLGGWLSWGVGDSGS